MQPTNKLSSFLINNMTAAFNDSFHTDNPKEKEIISNLFRNLIEDQEKFESAVDRALVGETTKIKAKKIASEFFAKIEEELKGNYTICFDDFAPVWPFRTDPDTDFYDTNPWIKAIKNSTPWYTSEAISSTETENAVAGKPQEKNSKMKPARNPNSSNANIIPGVPYIDRIKKPSTIAPQNNKPNIEVPAILEKKAELPVKEQLQSAHKGKKITYKTEMITEGKSQKFVSKVSVEKSGSASGEGSSKKNAENAAAKNFLKGNLDVRQREKRIILKKSPSVTPQTKEQKPNVEVPIKEVVLETDPMPILLETPQEKKNVEVPTKEVAQEKPPIRILTREPLKKAEKVEKPQEKKKGGKNLGTKIIEKAKKTFNLEKQPVEDTSKVTLGPVIPSVTLGPVIPAVIKGPVIAVQDLNSSEESSRKKPKLSSVSYVKRQGQLWRDAISGATLFQLVRSPTTHVDFQELQRIALQKYTVTITNEPSIENLKIQAVDGVTAVKVEHTGGEKVKHALYKVQSEVDQLVKSNAILRYRLEAIGCPIPFPSVAPHQTFESISDIEHIRSHTGWMYANGYLTRPSTHLQITIDPTADDKYIPGELIEEHVINISHDPSIDHITLEALQGTKNITVQHVGDKKMILEVQELIARRIELLSENSQLTKLFEVRTHKRIDS